MTVTELIFKKLMLAWQLLANNLYSTFNGKPKIGLVTHSRLQGDGKLHEHGLK